MLLVDDEVVAEGLGQPVADVAGEDVGRAAGWERYDHLDDAVRVTVGRRGGVRRDRGKAGERSRERGDELAHGCSFRHLVGLPKPSRRPAVNLQSRS
jgi:hypothetical protein